MIKKIYLLCLWAFLALGFSVKRAQPNRFFTLPNGITSTDFQANTLIIKLKESSSNRVVKSNISSILRVSGLDLIQLDRIFPTSISQEKGNLTLEKNETIFQEDRYFRLKYTGQMPITKVINQLLRDPNIAYAEPSYIYQVDFVPNDTRYSNQFFLPQVKAPAAWDIYRNAANVLIGIVDTGGETTHEDLSSNIYLNNNDPINGVDDDGDGYIDNYYGWDFCGATASTMIGDNDPNVKSADADHGVHVSGIASAITNNGKGVASVAGNAKLLIVKAGADDKPRSIYKGYEGIKYAVDMGAKIINCSWGGVGGGQFGQDIINYAISKGCLVVAAAGNSANDIPIYPAAFDGVLAVANLKGDDIKGQYSNYGTYVDISAPGEGILSTTFNNTYTAYSGTSMASPLVASAAALVSAYFPQLTGLQLGELLRATADNVDGLNPNYANKLGTGRLNVMRALTEPATAIRFQNLHLIDENLGNRAAGTTVKLQFELKNYLRAVSDLNVSISSNSPYIQVLDNQLNVGAMLTLETKSMPSVRIKILSGVPDNLPVTFTLNYSANSGSYHSSEQFVELFALDYLNVSVNRVQTTFTSNGRVGYSKPNANGGLGFMYKDENMLYEAALMIAKSGTQVSNNARFDSGYSDDFNRIETARQLTTNDASFEGICRFDDSKSTNPIGVEIKSKLLASNSTGNDKYVIVSYEITNKSGDNLTDIYTGLFTDWDLDDAAYNATEYNADNQLAYVYARKNATYPYAGVRLLSLKKTANPAYYPLSYQVANSFLADNVFTINEKYKTLTYGIQSPGLGYDGPDGLDVMFVLGSGPYTIEKNQTITLVYAFAAGDNLADLIGVSKRAQINYQTLFPELNVPKSYFLSQNYPNSAKGNTKIDFGLPMDSQVLLTLFDTNGRKIKTWINQHYQAGTYTVDISLLGLPQGIYFYELKADTFTQRKKMIVVR